MIRRTPHDHFCADDHHLARGTLFPLPVIVLLALSTSAFLQTPDIAGARPLVRKLTPSAVNISVLNRPRQFCSASALDRSSRVFPLASRSSGLGRHSGSGLWT